MECGTARAAAKSSGNYTDKDPLAEMRKRRRRERERERLAVQRWEEEEEIEEREREREEEEERETKKEKEREREREGRRGEMLHLRAAADLSERKLSPPIACRDRDAQEHRVAVFYIVYPHKKVAYSSKLKLYLSCSATFKTRLTDAYRKQTLTPQL
jgi:hypothetical protein